jgi:hypothetical protein
MGWALLAVTFAVGHPFAPLVVGDDRQGDEHNDGNSQKDLHGRFRIA